jgi:hypothetical protein
VRVSPSLDVIARGRGCVAIAAEGVAVVAVYISPNRDIQQFKDWLAGLAVVVNSCRPRPVLILGDFNAWSEVWGLRETRARGRELEVWAVLNDLVLLNRGSVPTCVRPGLGSSIVDLSFASPTLASHVQGWHVMEEVEALFDHRYIRFDVPIPSYAGTEAIPPEPRLALKYLNRGLLLEASIIQAWAPAPDRPVDIDAEAQWFREAMSRVCDAAMPRAKSRPTRRQVYWWTPEIASLHQACVAARRRYSRLRRRRRRPDDVTTQEAELLLEYRAAKRILQVVIKRAKSAARQELLDELERDPWGRPYLLVRGKLRPWTPPGS